MNGSDIALVIAAVSGGVPIVGGFVLQVITFNRQAKRDAKLTSIEEKVDGLGESREKLALRAGTAEGHAKGVADERAGGLEKAPIPVVVIADQPIPVVETSGKALK